MKILESKRLNYYNFSEKDYEHLLALETDKEATEFYGPIPSPKIVQNILKSFITSFELEKFSYFKINLKENDEFIGIGGFERHKHTNEVGIGYLLYKNYQHDSYPYEILTSLLNWGKGIRADYFISVVLKKDKATQKALESSGMHFYKEEKFDELDCFYYRSDNQYETKLLADTDTNKDSNLSDE